MGQIKIVCVFLGRKNTFATITMQRKKKDTPIIAWLADKFQVFRDKEQNFINKQRQLIMIGYAITIMLGLILNIMGISGSFHPVFTATNSVVLAIFIVLSVCYAFGLIGLTKTIASMAIAIQISISIDTVYCALDSSLPDSLMVILVNMMILSTNIIITLATYLTHVTQWMTSIAISAYVASMFITRNSALADYFFMLLLILGFISLLALMIVKNAKRLTEENTTLKNDEAELLQILRLNKNQVKAYIALAKQEHSTENIPQLLDLLGEKSQKNLINNVIEFMRMNETESERLKLLLPELTPSEIKICQLILRDKKLGEICSILNKSESNINTQRGNIRKKLGLQPTDNLQKALEKRVM